jgi:hypothetical protein
MPQKKNTSSLDNLLDSLGFDEWKTITVSFILPTINVRGTLFCTLRSFIFFRRIFVDPVFVYYRLLCLVYIIHLIHNIPAECLCSLRYFPKINTYLSSSYLIYYIGVSSIFFHFEDALQMAILLTRMKSFNLFVEKHFIFSPHLVSFTLLITCFSINIPLVFAFKINSFGTYFDATRQQMLKFYYLDSSDFSLTLFGRILFGFTYLILNLIMSVVVGVGLNIVSLYKYKSYVRQKRREVTELILGSINNRLTTTLEIQQFNQRTRNQHKKEKNMFYMVLILSSISIISRIFKMFQYAYFFFFNINNSFPSIVTLEILYLFIHTLVPTVAIPEKKILTNFTGSF